MTKNYNKQAPETIQNMFGHIAKSYDLTNALLSFQLHRLWNRKLIKAAVPTSKGSYISADLCCGTGAIALPWLFKNSYSQHVYLIDFCQEMLQQAKEKALFLKLEPHHTLNYIQANVLDIPLSNDSLDFATMAYGIRNVSSPEKCFQEVYRSLKPGGTFGILELTQPKNPLLKIGHRLYLKTIVPLLGKLIAKNGNAYEYLSQSIQTFIQPEELAKTLANTGFEKVRIQPLTGGIATLFLASKPLLGD